MSSCVHFYKPAFSDVASIEYNRPGLLQLLMIWTSVTCDVLGPTSGLIATVKLITRFFVPSSKSSHSPCTKFVVFLIIWKSVKNFDLWNINPKTVSMLSGNIVCTNCLPSCIDVHSVSLVKSIFDLPISLSLSLPDMSVGMCSGKAWTLVFALLHSFLKFNEDSSSLLFEDEDDAFVSISSSAEMLPTLRISSLFAKVGSI